MPKVSVIMPVYNKERYLEGSVRSVLDQPFRDLELIAVNDGSTDGSLALLNRFAGEDPRIRVLDIPNGGVSHARNTGLACARGEWIQFLDADDLLEPRYLTQAAALLEEHPADILFSGFTMVDERMNPVREVRLPETGMKNQAELCRCFADHQYKNGFFGYISNKLFRRELLEKSGAQFPVGTTLAEDLDFYARLYPAVETARFWDGKSFLYLQTDTNYIHNTKIDYYSQIKVQLHIRDWFRKSGMYPAYQDLLDGRVATYAVYILFYDNEEGKDLTQAFDFLRGSREIMDCVDPRHMTGFDSLVLRFLRSGSLGRIRLLFALRNGARSLYRSLKRHD